MALLLIAAEEGEYAGLIRRCSELRTLGWPLAFARSGALSGRRVVMVADGPGELARKAARLAIERERPEAVVSVGWCGALEPGLETGAILVAARVLGAYRSFESRRPETRCAFHSGDLVSGSGVVGTVEEKRRLRESGAVGVEMEAAGVAAEAEAAGLPFFCVRSVMDSAEDELVLDFNTMRTPDGRFSRARILRAALLRPRRGLPGLMRLRRQSREAALALGEFLADCRF
jgi:adenosylhomocysteine nucleosidase